MKPKGLLLVLSGPSGAGKGTICQMLREKLPDIGYSVSRRAIMLWICLIRAKM